jgi:hypothetical protein
LARCAEQSAIQAMASAGARRFDALVVVTDVVPPAAPCGACRQVLTEFAADAPVWLVSLDGTSVVASRRFCPALPRTAFDRRLGPTGETCTETAPARASAFSLPPRYTRPMQRHLSAAIVAALTLFMVSASALAQGATTRVVVFPFDASRSVDALGLASASAIQRAINQVDGLYAPPVGDALVVVQRANQAGVDPIAAAQRLFQADAIVLGRFVGQTQLEVELVVVVGEDDRIETVSGNVNDLRALWRSLTETALRRADVVLPPADLGQLRGALATSPSLPSLGPLSVASARLPGARLDDLRAALELDPDSAWLRAETARVALLEGDAAFALQLVAEASALAPDVAEVRVIEGVVRAALGETTRPKTPSAPPSRSTRTTPRRWPGLAGLTPDPTERAALLERSLAAAPRLVDAHLALRALQTDPQRRLQALRARRSASRTRSPSNARCSTRCSAAAIRAAHWRCCSRPSPIPSAERRRPTPGGRAARRRRAPSAAFVQAGRALYPDSAVLAIAEADLQVAAGDLDSAERILREVIAVDPGERHRGRGAGDRARTSRRLDEAEACWRRDR